MGKWTKDGRGGSYAGWQKERTSPKSYPKTDGQKKIGDAGREVGVKCKGKTGADFKECRAEVLAKHF